MIFGMKSPPAKPFRFDPTKIPARARHLREETPPVPFLRVADDVGRYGWAQASLTSLRQLDVVWPWIEASYRRLAPEGRGRKTGA